VLHGARDISGIVADEFGSDADAEAGQEEEPGEP
jgi:hypothetical protein